MSGDPGQVGGWKLTLDVPQADRGRAVIGAAIPDKEQARRAISSIVSVDGTWEPMSLAEITSSGLRPGEVGRL